MEKAGSHNSTVCVGSCCMLSIGLGLRERNKTASWLSDLYSDESIHKTFDSNLATPPKCCWKLGSLFRQLSWDLTLF